MTTVLTMNAADWLALFLHFLLLSLLSVGGALATAPEMHRYLVLQQHWLSDAQFGAAVAIAQAAPGPNVLFVGLLGWQIGMDAGGWVMASLGLLLTLTGILLPSTILTCLAATWTRRHRDHASIRAFKQGMAPLVVGLMLATGWILAASQKWPESSDMPWMAWLLAGVSAIVLLRWRRVSIVSLLACGALLGALASV